VSLGRCRYASGTTLELLGNKVKKDIDIYHISLHDTSVMNTKPLSYQLFNKPLLYVALISVLLYFIEMGMGYSNSLESPAYFIWLERIAAVALTIELFWKQKVVDLYNEPIFGKVYLIIGIISVLPFYVGFFVPVEYLGVVRALRILRVLKLVEHSRSLRLVYLSFYRARKQLKPLILSWIMMAMFSAMVIHQAEKNVQKEFDSVLNSMYFSFVTATTIGYGDMSPITPTGRILTIMTSGLNLALFAGLIGIVGSSISTVMKEEEDETIDPLTLN
jgi:voltage-gated potassium channel